MAAKKPAVTNPLNYLGINNPSAVNALNNSLYTPSAAQDYYSSSLGRYLGGVGPAPVAPTAPAKLTNPSTSQVEIRNIADGPITTNAAGEDIAPFEGTQTFIPKTDTGSNVFSGSGIPYGAIATQEAATKAEQDKKTRQAIEDDPEFKLLAQKFASYGMADFVDIYIQVKMDYPTVKDNLIIKDLFKTDKKYNVDAQGNAKGYAKRFAGNAALIKAGKIPLDDSDYIRAESEYEKIFKGYGLDTMANQKSYANLIGNDVSADEATNRIQLGYDKLKNNPQVLDAFRKFYPTLGDGDIVAGMLNSTEQLPALERKVTAAQIGGAALRQGLETNQATAEQLRGLGVDQSSAEAGYAKIAEALPTAQKLSNIYNEDKIAYTQGTAEEETFQNLASAKRKRMQLTQKEINTFSADSGRGKGAFSSPISI